MSNPTKHSTRPRLLAVFAHPDDESFLAGGTLAKYARSEWDVFLACATYGENGPRGEYQKLGTKGFGEIRRAELQAACNAIGTRRPMFLNCADGAVAGICWNSAAQRIRSILRRLRPDVVITFGPDGVSGHPDHVALSQIVTSAFWAATMHNFPGQEAPPHGASLYYALRSASVPEGCKRNNSVEPPPVTTVIDFETVAPQKLAAIQSHRSQQHLQPSTPAALQNILHAPEQFHRAYPKYENKLVETELLRPPLPSDKPHSSPGQKRSHASTH